MSDHERGAYTPQSDAPLSFDARQSRGAGGFPTTLVLSLLILAGLGVAIYMFYRSGVRGANQPPVPVGAPVGDIKSPPPASSAPPADAASGLQIYKAEGSAPAAAVSSAPVFAAPPQPRPAPAAPVVVAPAPAAPRAVSPPNVSTAAVAASGATSKPAPVETRNLAAKPAPNAAPGDAIGDLLRNKPAAAPAKPVQTAEAQAAPPAPFSAVHGAALVQFGAFSSQDLAGEEWSKLSVKFGADMTGKGKVVEAVERNGKTLFRGAVSGFASRADAVAFCVKLKAAGHDCIVR
jgi:hypothetical protein